MIVISTLTKSFHIIISFHVWLSIYYSHPHDMVYSYHVISWFSMWNHHAFNGYIHKNSIIPHSSHGFQRFPTHGGHVKTPSSHRLNAAKTPENPHLLAGAGDGDLEDLDASEIRREIVVDGSSKLKRFICFISWD